VLVIIISTTFKALMKHHSWLIKDPKLRYTHLFPGKTPAFVTKFVTWEHYVSRYVTMSWGSPQHRKQSRQNSKWHSFITFHIFIWNWTRLLWHYIVVVVDMKNLISLEHCVTFIGNNPKGRTKHRCQCYLGDDTWLFRYPCGFTVYWIDVLNVCFSTFVRKLMAEKCFKKELQHTLKKCFWELQFFGNLRS